MPSETMAPSDAKTAVLEAAEAVRSAKDCDVEAVREYLERGGDVNTCSSSTLRTLLHWGAAKSSERMVRMLLGYGASVGARTLRQLTPLHLACAAESVNIVVLRLLLEHGADADARDERGVSGLHLAAQEGDTDAVRLLLQCGADKDGREIGRWTPLHFAAWAGSAAVTRLLLVANAAADSQEADDGATPLHFACAYGHAQVVRVLLDFGAAADLPNADGLLPDQCVGVSVPGDGLLPNDMARLASLLQDRRASRRGGGSAPALRERCEALQSRVADLEKQLRRARREEQDAAALMHNGAALRGAMRPECALCRRGPKAAVFLPCRHLVACGACAATATVCPFCRADITGLEGGSNGGGGGRGTVAAATAGSASESVESGGGRRGGGGGGAGAGGTDRATSTHSSDEQWRMQAKIRELVRENVDLKTRLAARRRESGMGCGAVGCGPGGCEACDASGDGASDDPGGVSGFDIDIDGHGGIDGGGGFRDGGDDGASGGQHDHDGTGSSSGGENSGGSGHSGDGGGRSGGRSGGRNSRGHGSRDHSGGGGRGHEEAHGVSGGEFESEDRFANESWGESSSRAGRRGGGDGGGSRSRRPHCQDFHGGYSHRSAAAAVAPPPSERPQTVWAAAGSETSTAPPSTSGFGFALTATTQLGMPEGSTGSYNSEGRREREMMRLERASAGTAPEEHAPLLRAPMSPPC
ncbi:unnamed protein product [Phaeothamnion confervicola]